MCERYYYFITNLNELYDLYDMKSGLKSSQWHLVSLIQLWFPCNQEDLLGFNETKHIYPLNFLRRPDQNKIRQTGTKIILWKKFHMHKNQTII